MRIIYIDIRQLKDKIKPDETVINIKIGEQEQKVALEYQKVGFGRRRFFRCPYCSKRVERLYYKNKRLRCSKCQGINLYRGIMNNTKGSYYEIAYRMTRYAEKHNIKFNLPFNYLNFVQDERIGREKFRQDLKIMQALENMRFHSLFFGQAYKPDDFKRVLSGEHPLLQSTTLSDLKNNVYDWKTGKQIKLSLQAARVLLRR